MRVVIILFFMLMVQLRAAKAQEDFLYTNELGVTFGFEGDTKKGNKYLSGTRYALEYTRFYRSLQGIQSGVTFLRDDQHNYNISIPLYWVFRTPVIIPALGGEEDENDPTWLEFLKTFSTRLQFCTGLRTGFTQLGAMSQNGQFFGPDRRFSCSAHADIRLQFCCKHLSAIFIPGYDFHFTPDTKREQIHRWFFSLAGGISVIF